jgi:hypothetical protein
MSEGRLICIDSNSQKKGEAIICAPDTESRSINKFDGDTRVFNIPLLWNRQAAWIRELPHGDPYLIIYS